MKVPVVRQNLIWFGSVSSEVMVDVPEIAINLDADPITSVVEVEATVTSSTPS